MSEMVDRVARAISKCVSDSDRYWPSYVLAARAAIEAMREPTEAMKEAGGFEVGAWVAWTPMIDEALQRPGKAG